MMRRFAFVCLVAFAFPAVSFAQLKIDKIPTGVEKRALQRPDGKGGFLPPRPPDFDAAGNITAAAKDQYDEGIWFDYAKATKLAAGLGKPLVVFSGTSSRTVKGCVTCMVGGLEDAPNAAVVVFTKDKDGWISRSTLPATVADAGIQIAVQQQQGGMAIAPIPFVPPSPSDKPAVPADVEITDRSSWSTAGEIRIVDGLKYRSGGDGYLYCVEDAKDALDEVNQQRAARGLRPFIKCEGLTTAAMVAARTRAVYRISGHLASDFACVPIGYTADVAGCAAWPVGDSFGACDLYANHRYAGAAVVERHGVRWMHVFYRH